MLGVLGWNWVLGSPWDHCLLHFYIQTSENFENCGFMSLIFSKIMRQFQKFRTFLPKINFLLQNGIRLIHGKEILSNLPLHSQVFRHSGEHVGVSFLDAQSQRPKMDTKKAMRIGIQLLAIMLKYLIISLTWNCNLTWNFAKPLKIFSEKAIFKTSIFFSDIRDIWNLLFHLKLIINLL